MESFLLHNSDVFESLVLGALNQMDRSMLARVSKTCAAALAEHVAPGVPFVINAFLHTTQHALWAVDQGCPLHIKMSAHAASHGNLGVLKYLHSINCPWNATTCDDAARNGHLDALKWVRKMECPWDEMTCAFAAEGGHLDVLVWAVDNGCRMDVETCKAAVEAGRLDVLRWARARGCPWDSKTYDVACAVGDMKIIIWLEENKCPFEKTGFKTAAMYGHLHVIQFLVPLYPREFDRADDLPMFAALNGHLDVLVWIVDEGTGYVSDSIFFFAVQGGNLDVLDFLWSLQMPDAEFDEFTTKAGAEAGLPVLKWLRSKGCAWDASSIIADAARKGDIEMVKWVRANRG
jgi:hypothetical protein